MAKLDYHPNAGARALRGSRTNVIALAVNLGAGADLTETSPYLDTIIEEAAKRDFDVVLSTTTQGPSGLERLGGRRLVDAFVLMDVRTEDPRLSAAASLGLPVVLFGRPADRHGLDAVDFDTRAAAELLVEDLAATGHRHIVVVGETADVHDEDLRFIREFQEGARRRALERGMTFDLAARNRNGLAGIEEQAARIFAHSDDRLGVICRTPQVTEWAIQVARMRGLSFGIDLSLAAFCTDARATSFDPDVSNVSPQPRDLSRLAMSVLFDRLDGNDEPARFEMLSPVASTRRRSTVTFA